MSSKYLSVSLPGQAEDAGVHVDVLPPREVGVEPGAQLEQGRHPPPPLHVARGGREDAGDQLEQRGLARPVGPDEAQCVGLLEVERDVVQGPELLDVPPRGS